ncbi:hypothetical protein [Paractinoplanes toevensis]|uniref:Uncharacterized protein n=1 Tax=Paractinoplanes toevensis TaxID=571911 RepID=A0A919TBH8_9ACTN|nr:hypothetical protein [Actinoplanes toevensis]GIM91711.1 hypothetical protein Ato02nite_035040 [Actinoplanes toevensis]
MPIPIIFAILAAVAAVTAVIVAIIYYDEVIDWFRNRNSLKESDRDAVGITVKQRLEDGNYNLVQGIFNKREDRLMDARVVKTKAFDEKLENLHRYDDLVIYE